MAKERENKGGTGEVLLTKEQKTNEERFSALGSFSKRTRFFELGALLGEGSSLVAEQRVECFCSRRYDGEKRENARGRCRARRANSESSKEIERRERAPEAPKSLWRRALSARLFFSFFRSENNFNAVRERENRLRLRRCLPLLCRSHHGASSGLTAAGETTRGSTFFCAVTDSR